MAAPNVATANTIYGKVVGLAVPITTAAVLLSNAAASGKLLKVNSIIAANVNGTAAADITVYVYKAQTTIYYLAFTISVPAKATLVILSKDSGIYLEENDSILAVASAASYIQTIVSYEDISA